jgi:hypothetical protein
MAEIIEVAQGNPFEGASASDIKIVEPSDNTAQGSAGETGTGGFENTEDNGSANSEMDNSQEQSQPPVQKPAETTKPEEQSATAPTVPEELDITQVISKFDQKALLQALGYDEFAINALDYYKEVGSLDDYVAVKSIDFTKMTPEQIMRYDYARKYKGLPEDALEFKVKKDLRDKYGISEDLDEDQLKAPMALFSYEMDAVRKELIADQAKFSPPPRQAQPEVNVEQIKNEVLANPLIKTFMQNKALTLGPAAEALNFGVDPNKVLPLLYDSEAFDAATSIKDAKGNPTGQKDFRKLLKVAALLADDEAYDKSLMDHGKSLGKRGLKEKLENPSAPNEVGVPPRQEADLFEALANRGIHRGG